MNIGVGIFFNQLEQESFRQLWGKAFENEPPLLLFNGLLTDYTSLPEAFIGDFEKSLQGSACNTRLELRWWQIVPGSFEVIVLTSQEYASTLSEIGLNEYKETVPQRAIFHIDSGRKNDHRARMVMHGRESANRQPDRRLPRVPLYPANLKHINYLYYLDPDSRQVRFVRMIAEAGATEK